MKTALQVLGSLALAIVITALVLPLVATIALFYGVTTYDETVDMALVGPIMLFTGVFVWFGIMAKIGLMEESKDEEEFKKPYVYQLASSGYCDGCGKKGCMSVCLGKSPDGDSSLAFCKECLLSASKLIKKL